MHYVIRHIYQDGNQIDSDSVAEFDNFRAANLMAHELTVRDAANDAGPGVTTSYSVQSE